MTIVYCASMSRDIVDFFRSKPSIVLKVGEDLEDILDRLEETKGDIVLKLNRVNMGVVYDDAVEMDNAAIYDMFVRLQSVSERRDDGILFVWGINYPYKQDSKKSL